jgi:ATP-dependent phosphoenolpyruvate carboxykinase
MSQLAVITDVGDVFGTNIVFGANPVTATLDPVFQFSGAKIGFNPQDRFMVAMGNTLAVITQDGNVFGSTVTPSTTELGPIFQFSGAKIGFNPQDRFMVTMFSNYLTVITQAGDVFAAEVDFANNNISPVFQLSGAKIGFNPQDRFMVASELLEVVL